MTAIRKPDEMQSLFARRFRVRGRVHEHDPMTRHSRTWLVCTLAVSILCGSDLVMADSNGKAVQQAQSLMKAAAERSLFHGERNTAFGLLLKFELRVFGSKPTQGAYSWLLTPQGDSRQETKFLDYTDLEILRGTTLWIKRSYDYRPLQAGWIEGAFSQFLRLDEHDVVTRYWNTSERHVDLRCIDLLRDKATRTLCFDGDNNLRKVQIRDAFTVFEFSDYKPVGKKFAPSRVTVQWDGRTVIDGTAALLTSEPNFDLSLLDPPPGALKRGGCLNPVPPSLKKRIEPEYPGTFRSAHRQGRVIAYILIGSDGAVRNSKIIETGGQYLDASVLKALAGWQFESAKCNDETIDSEAQITIDFSLIFIFQ